MGRGGSAGLPAASAIIWPATLRSAPPVDPEPDASWTPLVTGATWSRDAVPCLDAVEDQFDQLRGQPARSSGLR